MPWNYHPPKPTPAPVPTPTPQPDPPPTPTPEPEPPVYQPPTTPLPNITTPPPILRIEIPSQYFITDTPINDNLLWKNKIPAIITVSYDVSPQKEEKFYLKRI